MFRKTLMLCASLAIVGCGTAEEETVVPPPPDFREGLPSKEQVTVKEPGASAGQKLVVEDGEVFAFDKGQTSDFYKLTRGATLTVNGGTAWVLNLIEQVTKYTPTSLEGNVAVWGPYTDALSPNTFKVTITQTGDNSYSYKVEGKAKTAADTEFKTIISGSHTIATDALGNRLRDYGSGSILLDWDAAQKLPEHGTDVGTATIRYSRLDAQAVATVEADFRNVKDDERPGTRVSADYRYKEMPGAGGEFDFGLDKNFDTDPARAAIERLTIKSRWAQTGAGRADVKISGGDYLTASATVSECWDANFASQFLIASWVALPVYGDVSACGSFNAAVYSSL